MVFGQQDGPLVDGEITSSFLDQSLLIEVPLTTSLPIDVCTGIHRVGEDMVDRSISGSDPAQLAMGVVLRREGQTLGAEPKPDLTHRPQFCEAVKHRTDGAGNCFVWVKAYLAVAIAPDQADGQSPTQFTACCLIADSSIEPCSKDVKFGFTHGAFEPQNETIIEQSRMVQPVTVTNQGVSENTKVEQPVPIGIVARQSRDFQAKDDSNLAQGNFGCQAGKASAVSDGGAR